MHGNRSTLRDCDVWALINCRDVSSRRVKETDLVSAGQVANLSYAIVPGDGTAFCGKRIGCSLRLGHPGRLWPSSFTILFFCRFAYLALFSGSQKPAKKKFVKFPRFFEKKFVLWDAHFARKFAFLCGSTSVWLLGIFAQRLRKR